MGLHKDSVSYDDMKIRKAIKCYYIDKAICLGNALKNPGEAQSIIERFIYNGFVPEIKSQSDLLAILFTDLLPSLYDLDYKERKEKLAQIHREHFSGGKEQRTHDRSVTQMSDGLDIE